MTGTVSADVSEFQVAVDDTYNRDWLIFRVCDGDYVDRHAVHNLAWAVRARSTGKIVGFSVYVVYRPGRNAAILRSLNTLGVPVDCVVMIDGESWGGQISGDHSVELNTLAVALRARQGGRDDLVWAYGNRGPDLTVWPHKPSWLAWEVASYGGSNPGVANEAGWQYTDGQYDVDGLPSASPPFGRCDHNLLFKLPDMEVDPLAGYTLDEIADAVWARRIHYDEHDPTKTMQASTIVMSTYSQVVDASTLLKAVTTRVATLQAAVGALTTGGVDVPALTAAVVAGVKRISWRAA